MFTPVLTTRAPLRLLALALFLAFSSLDGARAQDAPNETNPWGDQLVFGSDEVSVSLYSPDYVHVSDLFGSLQRVHGRSFFLRENGLSQVPPSNLQIVGDGLLIYDTPTYSAKILATLETIDVPGAKQPRSNGMLSVSDLELYEFAPRHVPLSALRHALAPFSHHYTVTAGSQTPPINVSTVTVSEDLGMVVVRDRPQTVEEIKSFLDRIDVPSPHVTLTCMVIQATHDPQAEAPPVELTRHLSQLLPYEHFEMLTMGLVTSSVKADELEMNMQVDGQASCTLELRPEAYDASTGQLTLSRAEFSFPGRANFGTQITLTPDEYMVLGAAGPRPIFVVLRMARRGQ